MEKDEKLWVRSQGKWFAYVCLLTFVAGIIMVIVRTLMTTSSHTFITEEQCNEGTVQWMPPVHCPQGKQHWSKEQLLKALPEFMEVFNRRPLKHCLGGMNIDHAFALWFAIKQIQPKHLIENGVFRGSSTYIMREAAGPDAFLYSLEPCGPLDEGYRRGRKLRSPDAAFEDPNPRSFRFMGLDFRDFGDMNWQRYIPEADLDKVFVMFDDHVDHIARLRQMRSFGFKHAWFDDNYNWQGTDCYSMNQVCGDIPDVPHALEYYTFSLSQNKEGCPAYHQIHYNMSRAEHLANLDWVKQHIEIYFEIPPLHDGCGWDVAGQLLTSDDLMKFGLPTRHEELYHYRHLHTPYVKLH